MSSPLGADPVFQGEVARPQLGLKKHKQLRILRREGLHQASSIRSKDQIPWFCADLGTSKLPGRDGVKPFWEGPDIAPRPVFAPVPSESLGTSLSSPL